MSSAPTTYLIRRKAFSLLDAKFHVYDASERLIAFSRQKAFKLREDIRIHADEAETIPMLLIQARQILDFSAAYDVLDPKTKAKLGVLRRKGLTSIVRDSWEFLDATDRPVATLKEDSLAMALLRRFINLIPQKFHVEANGKMLATYRQRFNPFILKLDVEVTSSGQQALDPRMYLAAGILLAAIEGRQKN
jgi:hypothetical protein